MKKPYSIRRFSTTADAGITVSADNAEDSLRGAAVGMFGYMFETSKIPILGHADFQVTASIPEEVPIAFLNELLFLFSARGWVPLAFPALVIRESILEVNMDWGSMHPARDKVGSEIKAVTYHQFHWSKTPDGRYHLRVVFDL
jgi:SHS2 domain-containing protein